MTGLFGGAASVWIFVPYLMQGELQIRTVTPLYSLSSGTAIDGKCSWNSKGRFGYSILLRTSEFVIRNVNSESLPAISAD